MEIAAATLGILNVTARTASKIWSLCDSWKEAPTDIHLLRDSLDRAHDFFSQVQTGIKNTRMDRLSAANPLHEQSLGQLKQMIDQGSSTIARIEGLVLDILDGRDPGKDLVWHTRPLNKRRKIAWLAKSPRLARHGSALKEISNTICSILVMINV